MWCISRRDRSELNRFKLVEMRLMWGTKRGVMVHFLVSLIICLMIFIPGCLIASKIFRTSEQAKDNFSDFVTELGEFAKDGQVGEAKSLLLIMDEGTAVVYFEKETQETVIQADAEFLEARDYTLHLLKPGQCSDDTNCLCLFREVEYDTELLDATVTVTPERVICTDLDYSLDVDSCSIGKGTNINSYTCEGGNFMLERNLAKDPAAISSYYEIPRRTILYFTKSVDMIHLIGNYGGTNEEDVE